MSFARALAGEPGIREWNYAERWEPNGTDPTTLWPFAWTRAVRGPRYKLIRNQGATGERLFDLLIDPDEQNDLIGAGLTAEEAVALQELQAVLTGL